MVNNITAWWLLLTPLKNDGVSSSVGMMTFPIYGKNVPNHQLDYNRKYLTSQSPVKSIQNYNSIWTHSILQFNITIIWVNYNNSITWIKAILQFTQNITITVYTNDITSQSPICQCQLNNQIRRGPKASAAPQWEAESLPPAVYRSLKPNASGIDCSNYPAW